MTKDRLLSKQIEMFWALKYYHLSISEFEDLYGIIKPFISEKQSEISERFLIHIKRHNDSDNLRNEIAYAQILGYTELNSLAAKKQKAPNWESLIKIAFGKDKENLNFAQSIYNEMEIVSPSHAQKDKKIKLFL